MPQPNYVAGETHFAGPVLFLNTVSMPTGQIVDADIKAGAAIAATKLEHQYALSVTQKAGTDVVAETRIVHVARGAGELVSVEAVADTVPTGSGVDKKVTIDVKRSTAGGAFATLLTGTFDIDSADTDKTVVAGTPAASPVYSDGDLIEIVVTVSGSAGSQAQGLCVTAVVREAA